MKTSALAAVAGYDELRAAGLSDEDILTGLEYQERQRRAGVPVYPLRVICGLEGLTRSAPTKVDNILTRIWRCTPKDGVRKPAALRKGGKHITGQPIIGGSVRRGDAAEADFVRPLTEPMRKRLKNACYLAFSKARACVREARAGRELSELEQRLTSYTSSCRDVFLALLDEEGYRKGWCIPSYERLMEMTQFSRRTVARALCILGDLGLIEWINRYIFNVSKWEGARSKMTSNLYRFHLPKGLAKVLGLHTPAPEDATWREDQRREDEARMLADAGLAERKRFVSKPLKDRFEVILAAVRADMESEDQRRIPAVFSATRECQLDTHPHPILYDKEKKESAWSADASAVTGHKRNRPSRPMLVPWPAT